MLVHLNRSFDHPCPMHRFLLCFCVRRVEKKSVRWFVSARWFGACAPALHPLAWTSCRGQSRPRLIGLAMAKERMQHPTISSRACMDPRVLDMPWPCTFHVPVHLGTIFDSSHTSRTSSTQASNTSARGCGPTHVRRRRACVRRCTRTSHPCVLACR